MACKISDLEVGDILVYQAKTVDVKVKYRILKIYRSTLDVIITEPGYLVGGPVRLFESIDLPNLEKENG